MERISATDLVDDVLEAWKRPRLAFLLGTLFGIIIVGSLVISQPAAFQSAPSQDVGATVVNHYQERAPTGVEYSLGDVEQHDSGLKKVTVNVKRGTLSKAETVFVTEDGKWVFERAPTHVQPSLANEQ